MKTFKDVPEGEVWLVDVGTEDSYCRVRIGDGVFSVNRRFGVKHKTGDLVTYYNFIEKLGTIEVPKKTLADVEDGRVCIVYNECSGVVSIAARCGDCVFAVKYYNEMKFDRYFHNPQSHYIVLQETGFTVELTEVRVERLFKKLVDGTPICIEDIYYVSDDKVVKLC